MGWLLIERLHPRGQRYMTDMYVPPFLPAGRKLNDAPPFWNCRDSSGGGAFSFTIRATRCGSSSNGWATYSYKFYPIIVSLSCGGWPWWLCRLDTFFWCSYFLFSRHSPASFSTGRVIVCLRFRGCPVVLGIELSVSARHQKTLVLLCARRLLCAERAAVCGTNFKIPCNESQAR